MEKNIFVPDEAVKYILFQRTAYLIYQNNIYLNSLVIRMPFFSYNRMVALEAFLFKKRIKRLFNKDIFDEYERIKNYLPKRAFSILDIGCGVAGIDVLLYRHYQDKNLDIYLLDKTEVEDKVYYGLERKAAFYNSLEIAKNILALNGVKESNIYSQEVKSGYKINFPVKFDLVISLISWGFHYPVDTYLDQVYNLLNPGGTLIMDVRKGSGGEKLIKDKFGNAETIYEAQKHIRVIVRKK